MISPIDRAARAVAAILVREGIDYGQSKAVIKRARAEAGLSAPAERQPSIDRLTLEEELAFIDRAFEAGGTTGLLLQTLLDTGLRVSEFTRLRLDDVEFPRLCGQSGLTVCEVMGAVLSYSIGDLYPRAEWRRPGLYQPSMKLKTAMRACALVGNLRRSSSSHSSVAKKLSHMALS